MVLNVYLILFLSSIILCQSFTVEIDERSELIRDVKRYAPNWDSIDSRPLPDWFDKAKIGIFIHWGVFSVPSFGSEWFWWEWNGVNKSDYINFMTKNYRPNFSYADFAEQFTAEFFNPNQWADIFKSSGAQYIVLTSKHHEGYTLWPSKVSFNWNSKDVGPHRDLVGNLAEAVRKANLRFGVYHSLFEWFNPLYLSDKSAMWKTQKFVNSKTRPELEELVNMYKPDVIWSDGDWEAPYTYWNSTDFLAWLYNDSPVKDTVVTNDRWGVGTSCKHGGFYSCADRYNPGTLQKHKWENAMTIDKDSWGYRRNAQLSSYLTTHDLITTLAQTVSCGGNILINIGPTHDGRIVPIFEERLRQLGAWLKTNGEAIYDSKPWTHQNDTIAKNVWYTSNLKNVYSIVLNWPQTNQLVLGAVKSDTIKTVELLGVKGNVNFTSATGGATLVHFPQLNPETLQFAYVLKISTK